PAGDQRVRTRAGLRVAVIVAEHYVAERHTGGEGIGSRIGEREAAVLRAGLLVVFLGGLLKPRAELDGVLALRNPGEVIRPGVNRAGRVLRASAAVQAE